MSLENIREGIIDGQMKVVTDGIQQALDAGTPAGEILNNGLIAGMSEVGQLFEDGEYFVPEMLIAARAMKAGLEILRPHLLETGVKARGRVAIGTVQGDLHDIGKSLVAMMLEGSGFEIDDLGVNVEPEKFIESIKNGSNVVAMSALLTTTMPNMKSTLEAIKAAGLRDQVVVLVGGAPVTEAYAAEIGADGYAADASSAARKAKQLLGA